MGSFPGPGGQLSEREGVGRSELWGHRTPPSHSKEPQCLTVPPGSMLLHLLCLLPTTFCSLFKVHTLKGVQIPSFKS